MVRVSGSFAIVAFVALLSSCSPRRAEIELDTRAVPASELIARVAHEGQKLRTVVGRGTVSFEGPEFAGSAAFELSLKRPDSLLVTLEGPFGIDVGTLFLSREKYVMYNSMENRVMTGVPTAGAIRSVIPFDMTYDQIMDAFSGSFPLPSEQVSVESYTVDEGLFRLSFRSDLGAATYWVDHEDFLVTRYELRDSENRLVMDASSSAMTEQDGIRVPRRVRVRFPGQGSQLSVAYSSITLNDPHPSFEFSIPINAHTVIR